MSNEKQCSVMTPVFEETRYKHHICSECGGTMKFKQSAYGGVRFYEISGTQCEKVKFCPMCGAEIMRFSDKPIYEKPIDLKPLNIFAELHREYERKAKWLYNCYISEQHRDQIEALIPLIEKGEITVYYQNAIDFARKGNPVYGVSYQTRKKLRKEFGEETE